MNKASTMRSRHVPAGRMNEEPRSKRFRADPLHPKKYTNRTDTTEELQPPPCKTVILSYLSAGEVRLHAWHRLEAALPGSAKIGRRRERRIVSLCQGQSLRIGRQTTAVPGLSHRAAYPLMRARPHGLGQCRDGRTMLGPPVAWAVQGALLAGSPTRSAEMRATPK